jgi:hypothetical protein
MVDSFPGDRTNDAPGQHCGGSQAGLVELRQLLVGPEQQQLHELQVRVERLASSPVAPEAVSTVLPEAIK